MELSKIRVEEKDNMKKVFIDGVEQKSVREITVSVLPAEITVVTVSFITDKLEVVRMEDD